MTSGRIKRNAPRFAFPTGVRRLVTITADDCILELLNYE